MIVSHKHKFVFLKTRKTASTSLQVALASILDPNDIIYGEGGILYQFKNGIHLWGHTPVTIIHELWPESKSYFTFTFERDPWSKCISVYDYMCAMHPEVKQIEFRRWIVDSKFREFPTDFQIYSKKGRVVADNIYRYDQLNSAIDELKNRIGDFGNLPSHNVFTQMSNSRGLYDEESALAVRRLFSSELEHFTWMNQFDPLTN